MDDDSIIVTSIIAVIIAVGTMAGYFATMYIFGAEDFTSLYDSIVTALICISGVVGVIIVAVLCILAVTDYTEI